MKNSFHYFTSASIPNSKAHCIQILKMCDALSEFYDLNLYCSFSRLKNTIKKDFHLNNNFKIINFYFFKFRALAFFQKLFFFVKINKKQNLFTREIVYAFWGIFFYKKIYLELHNNYPSLKNISYYLLPILSKNKKVKFIFISNELYKIYSKKIYIKNSNYVIAHDASENFNTRKSHLRIPNGNLNIGYAGSFYKGRGIDFIFDLAKIFPNHTFNLIGGTKEEIIYYKNNFDIHPNINLFEKKPHSEIKDFFFINDVLLAPYEKKLTSDYRDTSKFMSPLKIFEYMSSGIPIISSNHKVLMEVLNEDNAILCEPNNLNSWKSAIEYFEIHENRTKIAMKAYSDFILNYTWRARVNKILNEHSK